MGTSKEEQLQGFSAVDTLSVFGLMACVGLIVWGLVAHGISDQHLVRARVESEHYAMQILAANKAASSVISDRKIASKPVNVEIGSDPWGHPYISSEFYDESNRKVVVVYSRGPNGRVDTKDSDFIVDDGGRFIDVKFSGDDVGTVQKSWR